MLNHYHTQINKGPLGKIGGYIDRNIVLNHTQNILKGYVSCLLNDFYKEKKVYVYWMTEKKKKKLYGQQYWFDGF